MIKKGVLSLKYDKKGSLKYDKKTNDADRSLKPLTMSSNEYIITIYPLHYCLNFVERNASLIIEMPK
jgi:hypothetical protein